MPSTIFEAFASLMRNPKQNSQRIYVSQVPSQRNFEKRNFRQLQDLYTSLVEVRIIEDFIANAISRIPVKVVNSGGRELTNTNRLKLLLDKANPSQSFTELIKEAVIYYGITGNAFLLYADDYIYSLSSSNMKINLGRPSDVPEFLNFVASYTYEVQGMEYMMDEPSVFHLKTPQLNAENGLWAWGSSPYIAALPSIEALEANYSSRVSMIADRGALGVLTNRSQIPSKEQTALIQDALSDYGITSGKKKYIATTEDLHWIQMSLNTQELQLLEQNKVDFGKLCALRGVDPLIFSAEGSTYANQEQGIKESYKRGIIPIAEHFYDKLAEFLKYHFGGLYFEPNWEEVEELQSVDTEFSTKLINELRAGVITAKQAFEALYPDGTFEADKEKEKNREQMMQMMQNGEGTEEDITEEEKLLKWITR